MSLAERIACWSCRNVLDLQVDGRLTARAAARVASHLSACAECRAEEKRLKPVTMSKGALAVELPPGLADAILQKWQEGAEPEAAAPPALRLAPAQFAALAYLVVLAAGSAAPGELSRGLPGKPGIEAAP